MYFWSAGWYNLGLRFPQKTGRLSMRRVKILAGMKEFVGKTGTVIVERETKDGSTWMHRVRLDEPVDVPGVGLVTDDLWSGAGLKTIRKEPLAKPYVIQHGPRAGQTTSSLSVATGRRNAP
jgi:hypothetical protein